jgi:hypothetical protein
MMRCRFLLLTCLALMLVVPAAAQADFGFAPGSLSATPLNRDGTIDTQAGSHPYSYTVSFQLNTDLSGNSEGGEMRDVVIEIPPGLIGNPRAIPSCPRESFENGVPTCLPSTQLGVLRAILPGGFGEAFGPLYNLTPPPGVPAQLGFASGGLITQPSASVRTETDYGLNVMSANLPLEVTAVSATIWGSPADEGHTPERGPTADNSIPSEAPLLPFLTLPTSCAAPPQLTVRADSKSNPGIFVSASVALRDLAGHPVPLSGCEAVPFAPKILSGPSTKGADSATGLDFELQLPNQGLLNPKDNAVAETQPETTEVTFPAGIAANPSLANGIQACSLAQYRAATITNPGCPEASKVGTLLAHTPLLEEAIEGSVYLAAPRDNPAGSFLGIYIIARVPERGVLVKQFGEVHADPLTGQLTTTVSGLPPIPYSSFEVALREGPRAPLITPNLCGTYITTAKLYPFSDPTVATERTAPFQITTGAGGAPCAPTEAALPAHPTLQAGSTSTLAGGYTPFLFRVSRNDGEQRFASLQATLPKGLTGKLKGIPYCTEPQIAAAKAREVEGGGAIELLAPSCPQASQVGSVTVAAGAGPAPYYVTGKAYLAGPYKGAPLSLAIITPGVAGPFDLGAVVARAGLYVDESSGQITVKSDPIPTILQGIPLDVRKISVSTDRSEFTINPTNCEQMAVTGTVFTTTGATAPLQNRFQVGGCRNLPFSPKLQMSLSGATTRAKHPAFKAVLTQPQGQANLKRLSLTLPPTEFVDPNHVANPCTRPQFAEHKCPSSSVLGKVRAFTPLLDKPLEGPIYFRANGGERELPDAVADLNGQVHLISVGFVDALHHKGSEESRIRTTIATVPDAPIQKVIIELKGGKKHGLLVNSANICKSANRALVKMWGQNGKVQSSEPKIAVECGGKRRK